MYSGMACVGTQARLSYAAIAEREFCHYTVRYMYVCPRICYMLVTMCLCVQSL